MVIPKSLREAIGLADGGEVEIDLTDGGLFLAPPTVSKRLEIRDGRAVIVADEALPPLTDDIVGDVRDALRR